MGYQALLFCPEEKTARTVTQVLNELEFGVVACTEPFAAVKKLMSDHFDALVVDCDNEQNATLLFKSARNSTQNQASLAVAVVEGQAGVAKAFRFGANLVLTKPINVDQAKGTLRVARGLLRKGEPGKPAAPVAAAPAPAPSAPTPTPVKPAPPAPAASVQRAAAPVAAKSGPSSLPPRPVSGSISPIEKQQPVVSSASNPMDSHSVGSESSGDDDLLELGADDSPNLPAPSVVTAAETKLAPKATSATGFNGGAASAPAPALEQSHIAVPDTKEDDILETAAPNEPHSSEGPTTTFTFGGAAVEQETSGGSKKILFAVAAVMLVAVAGYFGWNYYHSRTSQGTTSIAIQHPVQPVQPAATPAAAPPTPGQLRPSNTFSPSPTNSQPAGQPSSSATLPDAPNTADNDESANDDATANPKKAAVAGATETKPAASKPTSTPMVVKSGHAAASAKSAAGSSGDAPAPSVIGIAVPGAGVPPLNLVSGSANAPKPVLEKLNVSQGVSQGLLIKKVNPVYPKSALNMRVEGSVQLLATISKTGEISTIKVLSGDAQLSKAAADAVKQWKYKPYLLNGEPVEIQTQVTINFRLPN